MVGKLADEMRKQLETTKDGILCMIDEINDTSTVRDDLLRDIRDSLITMSGNMKKINAEQEVLNLLWFPELRTRKNTVAQAHDGTYRWLLYDSDWESDSDQDNSDSEASGEASLGESASFDYQDADQDVSNAPEESSTDLESDSSRMQEADDQASDSDEWVTCTDSDSTASNRSTWSMRQKRLEREARAAWRERFTTWLETEDDRRFFFISGKPGSGKSTLMKSISQDPLTEELLQAWALRDGKPLILASFYFWISGSPLQKNMEGLYRSILWEIFQQAPELIQNVLPTHFRKAASGPLHESDLDASQLPNMFDTLIRNSDLATRYRICIFIDGLDEYDGDHWKLSRSLKSWCTTPDVKICVSSRPHNELVTSFGQGAPWLKLHEHTEQDIRRVVYDQFAMDERVTEDQRRTPEFQELARSLIWKAEGVFIWVVMTMQSLLSGLANFCSLAQLRKRLDDVPTELNLMFRYMFENIEQSDKQAAARLFLTINVPDVGQRLGSQVILQAFLDDIADNPHYAKPLLEGRLGPFITSEEAVQKNDAMARRLVRRSGGLLHIFGDNGRPLESQLLFVHRTVGEFLDQPEIFATLCEMACRFNPYHALALGVLAMFKHMAGTNPDDDVVRSSIRQIVNVHETLFQLLLICSTSEKEQCLTFLDEVDAMIHMAQQYFENEDNVPPILTSSFPPLASLTFHLSVDCGIAPNWETYAIFQSTCLGARLVAMHKLQIRQLEGSWVTAFAVLRRCIDDAETASEDVRCILAYLLENNFTPNIQLSPQNYHRYREGDLSSKFPPLSTTLWSVMVQTISGYILDCHAWSKRPSESVELFVKSFLEHGADQGLSCVGVEIPENLAHKNWAHLNVSASDFFVLDLVDVIDSWGFDVNCEEYKKRQDDQGWWSLVSTLAHTTWRQTPKDSKTQRLACPQNFLVLVVGPRHQIETLGADFVRAEWHSLVDSLLILSL